MAHGARAGVGRRASPCWGWCLQNVHESTEECAPSAWRVARTHARKRPETNPANGPRRAGRRASVAESMHRKARRLVPGVISGRLGRMGWGICRILQVFGKSWTDVGQIRGELGPSSPKLGRCRCPTRSKFPCSFIGDARKSNLTISLEHFLNNSQIWPKSFQICQNRQEVGKQTLSMRPKSRKIASGGNVRAFVRRVRSSCAPACAAACCSPPSLFCRWASPHPLPVGGQALVPGRGGCTSPPARMALAGPDDS